jgi:hypothetical protein
MWRRDRMIGRHAAAIVADGAADAAAEAMPPAAGEPAPMLVDAGPTGLVNARHIVPLPDARLDRQHGGPWIL